MINNTTPRIFSEQNQQLDLRAEMMTLLQQIGPGHMMNTAYDTAWVARLHKLGEPMALEALNWLREHQLTDGSWGAEVPVYHHDRVICTLAAAIALAEHGAPEDRARVERAMKALDKHLTRLYLDQAGETIAFEMLFPTLIDEAKKLGLIQPGGTALLNDMARAREIKLAKAPGHMINRFTTMAFSAEMAGTDGLKILDMERIQEENGSIGFSPSATAYYSLQTPTNQKALEYLRTHSSDGGVPNVAPFDVFEQGWVLWNLALAGQNEDVLTNSQPYLDFLEANWHPHKGIGFAAGYTPKDGDETSLIYDVLTQYGRSVNLDAVLSYEEKSYFRCFALESNPSISANIHVLSALRQGGLDINNASVQKILRYLHSNQTPQGSWIDKWHSSPYYTTAHLIITCAGYCDSFVDKAVTWILATQDSDGSWGNYISTAEETAYCLQALSIWKRFGHYVPDEALVCGADWLKENMEQSYPPLWIGKCLYSPTLVIRSAILSALLMVEQFTN